VGIGGAKIAGNQVNSSCGEHVGYVIDTGKGFYGMGTSIPVFKPQLYGNRACRARIISLAYTSFFLNPWLAVIFLVFQSSKMGTTQI